VRIAEELLRVVALLERSHIITATLESTPRLTNAPLDRVHLIGKVHIPAPLPSLTL